MRVFPWDDTKVASCPLTMRQALSRFSFITIDMPAKGRIAAPPATTAQGILVRGSLPAKSSCTMMLFYPLSSRPRHSHDRSLRMTPECTVDLVVLETSRRADHETFLEVVQLLLSGLQIADHFHEGLLVLVENPELLVKGVLHRVVLCEGVIVNYGNSVGDLPPYCLQRLLLSPVASDDNNRTTVETIEGGSHHVKRR